MGEDHLNLAPDTKLSDQRRQKFYEEDYIKSFPHRSYRLEELPKALQDILWDMPDYADDYPIFSAKRKAFFKRGMGRHKGFWQIPDLAAEAFSKNWAAFDSRGMELVDFELTWWEPFEYLEAPYDQFEALEAAIPLYWRRVGGGWGFPIYLSGSVLCSIFRKTKLSPFWMIGLSSTI